MRLDPKPIILSVLLATWLTACCGSGSDDATSSKDESKPVAAAASHGKKDKSSILTAGVKFGTTMCVEKNGSDCVNPTTTFKPDTPTIYLVHVTKDIPKPGDTYLIRWIAEDVGKAAPPNTEVFKLTKKVEDGFMTKVATHYTISTQATKPTKGWPVGKYKVVITREGKPVTTQAFTIQ